MPDPSTAEPTGPTVPNHHAHHPGFSGISGYLTALSFTVGRSEEAELAARLLGLTRGEHLVDIGCGSGAATRVAAGLGARVTGVDPARVLLDVARLTTRPRSGITWARGTAEALPVPDGGADAAWSLATVHHWADLAAGLAEVRRVLAPGGRFLAMERRVPPDADGLASHGWADAQAEAFVVACRDAGLEAEGVLTDRSRRGTQLSVLARRP